MEFFGQKFLFCSDQPALTKAAYSGRGARCGGGLNYAGQFIFVNKTLCNPPRGRREYRKRAQITASESPQIRSNLPDGRGWRGQIKSPRLGHFFVIKKKVKKE